MRIERTPEGDIAIVALDDEDNSNLDVVADGIGRLIDGGTRRIVFDLHGFHVFGTSTAVAYIVATQTRLRRREGLSKREALQRAGRVRLRPILMTTATTVLGLLPMALGLGAGSELRSPMALTVIGGLLTSTALTLLIIPAVYSVLDRGR